MISFRSQLTISASTVNMTCWFKYSGIFVPDQDGDWEFSLVSVSRYLDFANDARWSLVKLTSTSMDN